mgnify:CR=1 FL=1
MVTPVTLGGADMKSTGIVRQVDPLGRIVIPAEIRKTHGIKPQDDLEIFVDADKIILKKHITSCLFCGSTDNIVSYRGAMFCKGCLDHIGLEGEGERCLSSTCNLLTY